MKLNISNTSSYNFENNASLKEHAKRILEEKGANKEKTQEILNQTIFENSGFSSEISKKYTDYQLACWKSQIAYSSKKKLNETYKYIKQTAKSDNKHTLGELWEIFSETESYACEKEVVDILENYEVDFSSNNIFAA